MDRRHPAVKPGKVRKDASGTLWGVTVVDPASHTAGSGAAVMRADLGACVIEAEALEGDSPAFVGLNCGKLSVSMNLDDPDALGQHTAEIMREAGCEGAEIAALRASGGVGGRVP
jgi:crotonobetainyl-CoA:carnitine CoA-transferase CaiB-like acyl-CoA transferase